LLWIDPEQICYHYIELNSEKERNEVKHFKNVSFVSLGFVFKFDENTLFQIVLCALNNPNAVLRFLSVKKYCEIYFAPKTNHF
jgi:hypothetical protein